MLWYNILSPRNWSGVRLQTGNKKVDGVYYNLLSSKDVSLAASGTMYLVANSGIRLISPSFVDVSGLRSINLSSVEYSKIDNLGNPLPFYPGVTGGIAVKIDDDNILATDIITYDSGNNILKFPSANPGGPLYVVPPHYEAGEIVDLANLSSFDGLILKPEETDASEPPVITPATITANTIIYANSGINLGPNNNLDSYRGFILTHAGSGEPAEWKPAVYLRENYSVDAPLEGLERIGINWIRYPKRPALIRNGRLYIYKTNRSWSPYPAIGSDTEILANELGTGSDTLCVETAIGDIIIGYTKFAFVAKASSQEKIEAEFNFEESLKTVSIIDPNGPANEGAVPAYEIEIAPEEPEGIGSGAIGANVFLFSVTKGGYFPMQLEPNATDNITYTNNQNEEIDAIGTIETQDDGTLLETPITIPLRFKPSTINNLSIRPSIHTAFNMLGEDIDFVIYGKENTNFNNYNSIFDLNDNFLPQGLTPVFRVDASVPNSVSGSPSGVIYSKFIDRAKTHPIGWGFDRAGKVCIKTNDPYKMGSIPSGNGELIAYADVTISGHTYSKSIITEDIFLRPKPAVDNKGKYIRNALLTVNSEGQIVSRTPRVNPIIPDAPSGVAGIANGYGGVGNNEHSIRWDAPVSDGRSAILNYLIQLSHNNGENWIDVPNETIGVLRGFNTQTSATITQVAAPAIFRVAAQNGVGIGPYSEATDITFVSNTGLPQSPTNFTVTRKIDTLTISDVDLSWTPTNSWGSYGASGYLIEESTDGGSSWFNIAFIPYNEDSSHNETGLDGITNYLYRISAINTNNGKSAYNYVYTTGVLLEDPDLEEEENKKNDELTNFDFGVILFTGICAV